MLKKEEEMLLAVKERQAKVKLMIMTWQFLVIALGLLFPVLLSSGNVSVSAIILLKYPSVLYNLDWMYS
uniref:Uncharacterized protein n=1 Tax=Arundo donax TaxID=35708 RepID=A0A0A9FSW5_ARUDO